MASDCLESLGMRCRYLFVMILYVWDGHGGHVRDYGHCDGDPRCVVVVEGQNWPKGVGHCRGLGATAL